MIPLTVARGLSLALARGGGKIAVRCGGQVLTYADLDLRSNRIANALIERGIGKGDRLAIALHNCPEYILLGLACAKSGIVMVPHNYRFTENEYAFQLQDCGAKAIVYSERLGEAVRGALKRVPSILSICCGQSAAGDIALDELIATGADAAPGVAVSEHDPFYFGYTSGTTGFPKGAIITQRNRALAYHYWAMEFGIRDDDVLLHTGPFHHTAPFTFVLTQLYAGGEVVIHDHFDPRAVIAAVENERVTWGFLVPYMLDRLIECGDEASQRDVSSLRTIISGASALPSLTKEGIVRVFPAAGLHEFYGATEAGVITNLRPRDQLRKVRCVGQPVFDTEIEIRDEEGKRIPVGEVGDIWMRGPTIFSGYYNAPEKTQAVFQGDWCTLGDVGRMDEERYLYILDRRKDMIKSGGVNVYPMEIEEVLRSAEGVGDVSVIGVPDAKWGEAVHAVVVMQDGCSPDPAMLETICRQKLAGYKIPKTFEFREGLPRNANGKVLKRALREQFAKNGSAIPAV